MKPRIYSILSSAIEFGITQGYKNAFKHTDSPSESTIVNHIKDAILFEISEYFVFDEDDLS